MTGTVGGEQGVGDAPRRRALEDELGLQGRAAWRRRVGLLLAATACCAGLASLDEGGEAGLAKGLDGSRGGWGGVELAEGGQGGGGIADALAPKTFGETYSSCRDTPAGCIGFDRGVKIFVPIALFLLVGAVLLKSYQVFVRPAQPGGPPQRVVRETIFAPSRHYESIAVPHGATAV